VIKRNPARDAPAELMARSVRDAAKTPGGRSLRAGTGQLHGTQLKQLGPVARASGHDLSIKSPAGDVHPEPHRSRTAWRIGSAEPGTFSCRSSALPGPSCHKPARGTGDSHAVHPFDVFAVRAQTARAETQVCLDRHQGHM
jgi:hypothetical protein